MWELGDYLQQNIVGDRDLQQKTCVQKLQTPRYMWCGGLHAGCGMKRNFSFSGWTWLLETLSILDVASVRMSNENLFPTRSGPLLQNREINVKCMPFLVILYCISFMHIYLHMYLYIFKPSAYIMGYKCYFIRINSQQIVNNALQLPNLNSTPTRISWTTQHVNIHVLW